MQRYQMEPHRDYVESKKHNNGTWVRYEDVEKLLEAGRRIIDAFDDQRFIRNVELDNHQSWFIAAGQDVSALAIMKEAVDATNPSTKENPTG